MTPTLEQVQDQAAILGIKPEKAEEFYHHYNAQGWLRANGQKITNLYSALWLWQRNQYKFEKKETFEQKMARLKAEGKDKQDVRQQ